MPSANVLRAYGLRVACPLPVPGSSASAEPVDVTVTLAPSAGDVEDAWSGPAETPLVAHRWVDGRALDYHRGRNGDTLLRWSDAGSWLIDAARTTVRGHSPEDPPGAGWQRVLLDSVLGSVALGRGAEALHAGAVAIDGGAVAILGASGSGKTSLLAALLARGHTLVADDIAVLTALDGLPAVHPSPPVMSLDSGRVAAVIGVPVAELGDETWVLVSGAAQSAVPLRALVLLDRRTDAPAEAALVPDPSPFTSVFGHVLNSGAGPARERARFDAVGAVIAAVPVKRLVAPLTGAEPDTLAALVEAL